MKTTSLAEIITISCKQLLERPVITSDVKLVHTVNFTSSNLIQGDYAIESIYVCVCALLSVCV